MITATLAAEDLQPGGMVDAVEAANSAVWSRHRVSSLIFHRRTGRVYALSPKAADPVFSRDEEDPPTIVSKMSEVFGRNRYAHELGKLFTLVELPLANLPDRTLHTLPVSRDYVLNLLDDHEVRVRAIRRTLVTRKNREPGYRGTRGFVVADVRNASLPAAGDEDAQILRVAEVRGRGTHRRLPGDVGTPVISSSRALVGFVVGRSGNHTLVLPAEDIARELDVDFIAPEAHISPVRYRPEVRMAAE